METNLVLYGAGGHAKVILGCLDSLGLRVVALFDDNPEIKTFMDLTVYHTYSKAICESSDLIISIGENKCRSKISELVKHNIFTLIHPLSCVSRYASVGTGSVVFQSAVIQPGAVVGRHCIINTGSIVEHDCNISDFVHISPNATLSGTVNVGEGTQIGSGAVVIPNLNIGKWSVIGAGAVVINDIPDFCVAVGNPARIIKKTNK